ncbi:DUF6282 family protein [Pedococcus sp. P5_B7]
MYCHANPDLFVRSCDDVGLARQYAKAGFAAALHRHHFSSTVERAEISSAITRFRLYGAIVLNESVGGINPRGVEVALRYGARMVVFPTLSSAHYSLTRWRLAKTANEGVNFGNARLTYADEDGKLTSEAREVLALVRDHGAALNVGYGSPLERLSVAREASRIGVRACVMTNPTLYERQPTFRQQSLASIEAFLDIPNTFVEFTAYSMDASYVAGVDPLLHDVTVGVVIRHPGRVILSSDGGMSDAPEPTLLLQAAVGALADTGLDDRLIRPLLHDVPALVLNLG